MKILKKILIINFLVLCFFVNINVFAFEVKFNSRIYADMDVPRITNMPSDVIVTSIKKNGPADRAGMRIDDQIIMIEGKQIKNSLNVYEYVRYSKFKIIEIVVLRKGKKIKLNVKPDVKTSHLVSTLKVNILGYEFSSPCSNTIELRKKNYKRYNECYIDLYLRKLKYLNLIKENDKKYILFLPDKIFNLWNLSRSYINLKKYSESINSIENAYKLASDHDLQIKSMTKKGSYLSKMAQKEKIAWDMGNMYLNEVGVRNYKKALKYLTIAKDSFSKANREIGLMYLEGRGTNYDENKAFDLIRKSSLERIGIEHVYLGDFYLLGLGGANKNFSKAIRHYKLAELGSRGTINFTNIRVLYKYNRLPHDAVEYYNWLKEDLNEKSFSLPLIERLGYFSNTILKNYPDAYKWYYVCSKINFDKKKNKIGQPNTALYETKERCVQKLDILEKEYLSPKTVEKAKNFGNDIINNSRTL